MFEMNSKNDCKNEHKNDNDSIDLYLINVPIGILNVPSLALGILKPAAVNAGLNTKVLYANIFLAKYIGLEAFRRLNLWANSTTQLIEILFQPYAGYESYASFDEIEKFYLEAYPIYANGFKYFREVVFKVWDIMESYLDEVCNKILESNPKVVGCSYGLQQANASLAILNRIKKKRPDIITFIGGSSCSEYSGQALVDYMPQVDYVFTGESDDVFAPAIKLMIEGNKEKLKEEYSCVLQKGGVPKSHAMSDLNLIPYPDYDDYFEQLKEYDLLDKLHIVLPVESSRGCWWGSVQKCRFCGLHNSKDIICYRKKDIKRTVAELDYLSTKYGIKEFLFADCILDNKDIKEFPLLIGDRGYLSYAEVKTNMTIEEMKGLKKAGFIWLQPGIEAIQDDLLVHMNKGNRAIKHIEFLKWASTIGIICFWNLMTGFPDEKLEWYDETMERIPLLHHLLPPNRNTFIYQRNSYFTIHGKDFGVNPQRADFYPYFFGKNLEFLEKFAEYYEVEQKTFSYHEKLEGIIDEWRNAWEQGTSFTYFSDGDFMGIFDGRACAKESRMVLTGIQKEICELAVTSIKISKVKEELSQYSVDEIDTAITELINSKIIIEINGEILFLAISKEQMDKSEAKQYWVGLI